MTNWQRFLVILQLCFAFSAAIWYATQPFMGEYFSLRSRMLIHEYVMGKSDLLKNQKQQGDKLERNAERFSLLPAADQKAIVDDYRQLQNFAQRPALAKILDGVRILLLNVPPFQLAWIFFSALIGILALLKVPGAKNAAWVLPLIALAFAVDNRLTGHTAMPPPDTSLFPDEHLIVQEYLSPARELSQEGLQEGWNNYLIAHWSSPEQISQSEQLESAEFNFTRARLMRMINQPPNSWLASFDEKSSLGLLGLYFGWNLYFAWILNRRYPL